MKSELKSKKQMCNLCCTQIQNFSVKKGGREILNDVNLHLHCGELTAIIGPNGAGKSTLLKAIVGEVKHTGELQFLDEKNVHTGHPTIGYVPQHLNFDLGSPTSVQDLFLASKTNIPVWFGHSKKVRESAEASLRIVHAEHLIDRKLGNLSGGELQRVLLALALDPLPDLLLLDEPVSGIDQKGMEVFYGIVSELRKSYDLSIILISHDLPLVSEYADRVVFLNKTVICNGKPDEVFRNEKVTEVFGQAWLTCTSCRKGDKKNADMV